MRAPRVITSVRWPRRLLATLSLVIAIAVVIGIILGTESPASLSAANHTPHPSGNWGATGDNLNPG